MKVARVLSLLVFSLLSNAVVSQNDTMYVVQGDSIIGIYPVSSYDSITFYHPNSLGNSIIDADGNMYSSVTIGTQEWMSENLRTTKYSDGTVIPNVTGQTDWSSLNTAAWCHYDNDSSQYEATCGKLYNWYAASDSSNICPIGWHVPTDAEWTVLTDYLAVDGHSGSEATALKATSGWGSGNGTDDYGWSGLPGGFRSSKGFSDIVGDGRWWSSSENNTSNTWNRYLSHHLDSLVRSKFNKHYGFSVRCLEDDTGSAIQGEDSVYIVKGDSVMAVYATTDLDSVIFYTPNPIDTTTNSTINDADGNVYTSVTIGTQEWMTENLRTSKYSDGTAIRM